MMRLLLLILALAMCTGCAKERGVAAADNRSRLEGATINVEEVIAWLAQMRDQAKAAGNDMIAQGFGAVHDRLANALVLVQRAHDAEPAVSEVRSVDMPPPTRSAKDLAADAGKDVPVPPEPKGTGALVLAGLTTAGVIGAYLLKTIAPMVPGAGPVWKMAVDGIWSVCQHADAKQADAAVYAVASAARSATPLLQAVLALPPEALPPEVGRLLTPALRAGAQQFTTLAAQGPA